MTKEVVDQDVEIVVFETRAGFTLYINGYRVCGVDPTGMVGEAKKFVCRERDILTALEFVDD